LILFWTCNFRDNEEDELVSEWPVIVFGRRTLWRLSLLGVVGVVCFICATSTSSFSGGKEIKGKGQLRWGLQIEEKSIESLYYILFCSVVDNDELCSGPFVINIEPKNQEVTVCAVCKRYCVHVLPLL
jgi:hypothetical protein